MQVHNPSLRLWTVRGINVVPGETVPVPDEYAADLKGHPGLVVKEEAKKPGRPAAAKEEVKE